MKYVLMLALLAPLPALAENADLKRGDLIFFQDPDLREYGNPLGWSIDRVLEWYRGPTAGKVVAVQPLPGDRDKRVKVTFEVISRKTGEKLTLTQNGYPRDFKKLDTKGELEIPEAFVEWKHGSGKIKVGDVVEDFHRPFPKSEKPARKYRVLGFTDNGYVCVQDMALYEKFSDLKGQVSSCIHKDKLQIPKKAEHQTESKADDDDKNVEPAAFVAPEAKENAEPARVESSEL